jgi:transcriptional regulator with XRE-family HTH domain
MEDRVTPGELRDLRKSLGMSAARFERAVGYCGEGRTVRRWERNDPPTPIPQSVEIIAGMVQNVPGAREWLLRGERASNNRAA